MFRTIIRMADRGAEMKMTFLCWRMFWNAGLAFWFSSKGYVLWLQTEVKLSNFSLLKLKAHSISTTLKGEFGSTKMIPVLKCNSEATCHIIRTHRTGCIFLKISDGSLLMWLFTDQLASTGEEEASLVAHRVKSLPAMHETWVRSPSGEDPLEKEMATHFSTLAWKIPWTEEPDGLQSMGSQSQTRLSDFTRKKRT